MIDKVKAPKLVAAVVLFRRNISGYEILTQVRKVINHDYDPVYNGTLEGVAETLSHSSENFITATRRGVEEELGSNSADIIFYGSGFSVIDSEINFSTRECDSYDIINPLLVAQAILAPQPWITLGFAGEVSSDWEPDVNKADGEASEP